MANPASLAFPASVLSPPSPRKELFLALCYCVLSSPAWAELCLLFLIVIIDWFACLPKQTVHSFRAWTLSAHYRALVLSTVKDC